MNVAPPSIAPAQPPVSSFRQGAQTAAEDATPQSFANAMQSAQPKDATQSSPSAAATPQPATDAEEASKPSLLQELAKNGAPVSQVKSPAVMAGEDASPLAIHAAALGSATGNDGPCLSPQPHLPGAQPAPGVGSAPSQDAMEASALQPPTDSLQGSDERTRKVAVGTSVINASAANFSAADAAAADAAVADADPINTPMADASIADASAPPAALTGKKVDTKAPEAIAGAPLKKALHAHAASVQAAGTSQPATVGGHPMQVAPGAVTSARQPDDVAFGNAEVSDPTSVPIAIKTAAQIVALPNVMQAGKHPAAALQGAQIPSAAQPAVSASAPAPGEASAAYGSASIEATVSQGAQLAGDEGSNASFPRSMLSEAIAAAPRSVEPGAVFAPTLVTQITHGDTHHASAALSITASPNAADGVTEGTMVQAAPLRRLDIAVNDPLLGNIDVRAEMRGGVLHASLTAQESTAAAMPALHQFLQQHDVNVHTLTFATAADGVAASGSASSGGSGMGRDTAGGFAGGAGTGSQQQAGNGAHPQHERSTAAHTGYTSPSTATYTAQPQGMSAAVIANNVMPIGSRLSIHI